MPGLRQPPKPPFDNDNDDDNVSVSTEASSISLAWSLDEASDKLEDIRHKLLHKLDKLEDMRQEFALGCEGSWDQEAWESISQGCTQEIRMLMQEADEIEEVSKMLCTQYTQNALHPNTQDVSLREQEERAYQEAAERRRRRNRKTTTNPPPPARR